MSPITHSILECHPTFLALIKNDQRDTIGISKLACFIFIYIICGLVVTTLLFHCCSVIWTASRTPGYRQFTTNRCVRGTIRHRPSSGVQLRSSEGCPPVIYSEETYFLHLAHLWDGTASRVRPSVPRRLILA